ncbi:16S rRNA (uracil(1498)-N(3))-methyltransferase [Candidatus Desantisbacteria bacterium]|nr:16S rRNA (uracil(1498)-N(3))-methyltransferase [Candidatus Desantisbacteria bacterium]
MHLHQFFVNHTQIKDNKIFIKGNDARHISGVLRLLPGDHIKVVDKSGNRYNAVISSLCKDLITSKIVTFEKITSPKIKLNLYSCILKGEAWDHVLKKGTELGVAGFIPVISERTIIKIKTEEREQKLLRWEKIVHEAAKQCKRIDIPFILPIKSFKDAVKLRNTNELNLIFWEEEKYISLKKIFPLGKAIDNINIFVGPEGGFTEDEIKLAQDAGIKTVSLNSNILRADTAAICAIAVLFYEINDFR